MEDKKIPLDLLLAEQMSPWPLLRCPVLQPQPSWWPPLDALPSSAVCVVLGAPDWTRWPAVVLQVPNRGDGSPP